MNRIQQLFKNRSKKVIPFITAGYPQKKDTLNMVIAAESAGASMVEIGMPFSDPLADGPIIQKSSQTALENGVTLKWILNLIHEIRKQSEIPIALMGYVNPIIKFGLNEFLMESKDSGVDGLIIPDFPPEEAGEYLSIAKKNNLSPILLVAPNTPSERIKKISELANDLIYCVSILGVTGNNDLNNIELNNYLARVQNNTICPYVVGFGIKNNIDVININKLSHGAVIGSAIIQSIEEANDPVKCVHDFVKDLLND